MNRYDRLQLPILKKLYLCKKKLCSCFLGFLCMNLSINSAAPTEIRHIRKIGFKNKSGQNITKIISFKDLIR